MIRRASESSELVKYEEDGNHANSGSVRKTGEVRVTKVLPDEDRADRALEPVDYRRLHSLMAPVREVELSLARLDPHLVALHELDPRAVTQYNRLAITVISSAARRPLKRLLISSARHGDGRTCVTLNLAAALATTKQRVLVIDADLQRPSVSRLLGIDSEVGLAEAVANNMPPDETVTRLLPVDFYVLPTRGQVENSAELLASPNFGRLIEDFESRFDFILFDTAPLLTSADVSLLSLHADAALLVVRPYTTSAREMGKAISLLTEDHLFGVVMNRTMG
ncbi:MAG: CpsD/CapB family tyrosine-protein kinase [Acidobacteria bacterium]|nr:CpsD/CapB family tyrosine-protein kinase [Acidobacteriota bacterium]